MKKKKQSIVISMFIANAKNIRNVLDDITALAELLSKFKYCTFASEAVL